MTANDRTGLVLGDVIRAALDDCRIRLPVGAERRLVARAVEMLAVLGYELTRSGADE